MLQELPDPSQLLLIRYGFQSELLHQHTTRHALPRAEWASVLGPFTSLWALLLTPDTPLSPTCVCHVLMTNRAGRIQPKQTLMLASLTPPAVAQRHQKSTIKSDQRRASPQSYQEQACFTLNVLQPLAYEHFGLVNVLI